jgi:hypothetical protein
VDTFDQKVDERFRYFIPDNALYSEVYSRCYQSEDHIVYRIKARSPDRPLSVYDFKTIESLNKGKGELSQGQMANFLARCLFPAPSPKARKVCPLELQQGEQVFFLRESFKEPFHESVEVQAKRIKRKGKERLDVKDDASCEKLVERCWELTMEYVTAFSKLEDGGSTYFGMAEDKTSTPIWNKEDPPPAWLTIQSSNPPSPGENQVTSPPGTSASTSPGHTEDRDDDRWHVWSNPKDEPDSSTGETKIYYLAKTRDVKCNEKRSGKIIAEAVVLPTKFEEHFKLQFIERLRSLAWLGIKPQSNPVEISFHPVQGQQEERQIPKGAKMVQGAKAAPASGARPKVPASKTSSGKSKAASSKSSQADATKSGLLRAAAAMSAQKQMLSGGNDLKIIEIRINYYHGLCFSDKGGPELYQMRDKPGLKPERITKDKWLDRLSSAVEHELNLLSKPNVKMPFTALQFF